MQSDLPNSDSSAPKPVDQLQADGNTPVTPKKTLSKKVILIAGGVLLLMLIIGLGVLFGGSDKKALDSKEKAETSQAPAPSIEQVKTTPPAPDAQNPSQIMVYGAWTGQTTVIKAVDLGSSNSFLVATLPLEIKKVSVLSSQNLLYIDQVDTKDHGKRITVYNIKDKSSSLSIPASAGYVIDDYVLSPDKKYLAIWEVSFAQGSQVLQGGKSRVYAVDLSQPSVKNLLYDEQVNLTNPIHYPRAILNSGKVFADMFLPNDPNGGAGWAYGMSVVDFDGTNKRNLENMKAGTYGTQPSLSPDGKYLVFSGYDGSKGDGKAVKDGYRQALLTPNTVDVLNTESLKRFTLPNLTNANTYAASNWEVQTGNIILTVLSKESSQTGVFSYNLRTQSPNEIVVPSQDTTAYGYISKLNESKALIGTQDTSASNLGNLGENYAYAFTQLALLDFPSSKVSFVSLEDSFAQYITLLPSNYFETVLGIKTIAQAIPQPTYIDMYSDKNAEKKNLQLYTFFLKSDLSPQRLKQQSTPIQTSSKQNKNSPTCEQLAETQCQATGIATNTEAYEDCVKTNKNINKDSAKNEGRCHDSPLYLYGQTGKSVRVKIQTPIYNTIPASEGEYAITLSDNGAMVIHGKAHQSIAYDYASNAKRITPPTKGNVVSKTDVERVLREYADKLGLNPKETADLVTAGITKVTSPYAFISFFNQEQSEQILPISFSPKPDNYLNVVFYFKLYDAKPDFTPASPIFPAPLKRSGFTAVEVSEMVE
ncbi:MAG: hypothetical protein H0W89_01880 [Candidatus Levybacteria bacterium]|nr:hypothetical protein [Candidatus Levybacteria bacterium]